MPRPMPRPMPSPHHAPSLTEAIVALLCCPGTGQAVAVELAERAVARLRKAPMLAPRRAPPHAPAPRRDPRAAPVAGVHL